MVVKVGAVRGMFRTFLSGVISLFLLCSVGDWETHDSTQYCLKEPSS